MQVTATLKGISPLLMHSFPLVAPEGIEKKSASDQAEISAYRDADTGRLYIPGVNIQRSFVAAAVYSKGRGRASLQKFVAASVFVSPEHVDLGVKEYAVDSRSVVIQATRGRIVRHRPRLDQWECTIDIEYDPNLVTEVQLRRVVDDSGRLVGLLDFRPEKKGPFGRFIVTHWTAKE